MAPGIGAPVGTVQTWDARQVLISRKAPASTHGLGVAEAIELARVLGRLPARLQVYVIEGQRFEHGAKISPELHSGIEEVVHRIVDAVSATVCATYKQDTKECGTPRPGLVEKKACR